VSNVAKIAERRGVLLSRGVLRIHFRTEEEDYLINMVDPTIQLHRSDQGLRKVIGNSSSQPGAPGLSQQSTPGQFHKVRVVRWRSCRHVSFSHEEEKALHDLREILPDRHVIQCDLMKLYQRL
jgi:hypothetical protein